MAVIQKLRNSNLVAIAIGAALVLFIVGDWLTGKGQNAPTDEDRDVIAEIAGEKIREAEIGSLADKYFKEELDKDPNYQLDEEKRDQLFQKAWFDILKNNLINKEIDEAGIVLSEADINEMLVGENPHESIKGDPAFQTDNQFDPQKVVSIFRQAKTNPQMKKQLANYINRITANEGEMRFASYLAKARAFTTKVEQAYQYTGANQSVEGKVLTLNAAEFNDGDVKVTDEAIAEYLDLHKEEHKYEKEARDIKYVVFNIVPSADDTLDAQNRALRVAQSYQRQSENPDTLGATPYINRVALGDDEMPAVVKDSLWDASNGKVVGPVYKDGVYSVYQKVDEKKDTLPIVNVSHILIPFSGDLPNGTKITDSIQAENEAKKVFAMVSAGKTIAELAGDYSADPGSASKGGSYGWADPNQYVEEYKNFCLSAKKGQLGLVKTQYGFHIMRMMEDPDYRKIRFVMNRVEVQPGTETVKRVDELSRKFKNQTNPDKPESFEEAAKKMSVIAMVENDFASDTRAVGPISEMSEIRQLLYWLLDDTRTTGEISEVFAFPTKHVIVKVENIKHMGYATVDNVRKELEGDVRRYLKVKLAAQKLNEAVANEKDLDKLAEKLNGTVVDLGVARFGQGFLPQIGSEFNLLGAAFGLEEGITSKAIMGKEAAGIVQITKSKDIEVPESAYNSPEEDEFIRQPNFMVNRVQEVLMRSGSIQDYRYKFDWYN